MTITSRFDKGDIVYVIFNNHFSRAKVLAVVFKESKFHYNLRAADYYGFESDISVPEFLCGSSVEELAEIHTRRMENLGDTQVLCNG